MSLKITIDADSLSKQFKEFAEEAKKDIEKGVKALAVATYGHVMEEASQKLHSSLETFKNNCQYEEIIPGLHVISVAEKAMWIEEGFENPFDMKPGILAGKSARNGANGKYAIVPFQHTKGPSRSTPEMMELKGRVMSNLKKALNTRKPMHLEHNPDGSPKLGKLHSFDFPEDSKFPGKANTGDLMRVSVYQTKSELTGKVKRDIVTFRTVSSRPASEGKWIHPPEEGKKFLDAGETWAMSYWENEIWPEIVKKWETR